MATADALPAAPSRFGQALERLRTTAAVVAAVAGAVTGAWTMYRNLRTQARQETAASYETLAPQINQLTEAMRQLELDNQQLRQALAGHAAHPRTAAREKPAAARTPATKGAAPTPAEQPAPAQAEAQAETDDPLGKLIGTVTRTRDAVDSIRKVPDSFQQALKQKGH
jgi:regulator of replication initiation timing